MKVIFCCQNCTEQFRVQVENLSAKQEIKCPNCNYTLMDMNGIQSLSSSLLETMNTIDKYKRKCSIYIWDDELVEQHDHSHEPHCH